MKTGRKPFPFSFYTLCFRLWLCFTLWVLLTGESHTLAHSIVLSEDAGVQDIGTYLEILEDPKASLSFEDILSGTNSNQLNWFHSKNNAVGFGFTESVYWVKFTVENSLDRHVNWLLNQEYPIIDHMDVYIPNEKGEYTELQLGDYQSFSKRPIINKTFVIPMDSPPGTSETYYLRFQTTSSLHIALKIWSPEAFKQAELIELPLLWMFIGLLTVMFAINFIVLIYTREFAYLYYVLYIGAFTLLMMSLSGVAFQYLWPEAIWWTNINNPLFISIVIFSIIQFARHMIQTSRHSWSIDLILKGLLVLSIASAAITLITNSYRLGIITSTALTGIASAVGFYFTTYLAFAKKHKVRDSRIFFFSFCVFLVGILLFVLKTFSILPTNFITIYAIRIGASIQIIMLTFVLPDRLNRLKEELTLLNESLEDQVKERTAQLHSAQEQLLKSAHKSGMADMARDTMHSIGNIVNSMNVAIQGLHESEGAQLMASFKQANALLRTNFDNLEEFILQDPMGPKLMEFYLELENGLDDEQNIVKNSIGSIADKIKEIINVIATQQDYVEEAYFEENTALTIAIEDALESQSQNVLDKGIKVEKVFQEVPKIRAQTQKLNFIFTNLIANAIQAMSSNTIKEKTLTLSLLHSQNGSIHIKIQDTGIGIPPAEIKKIFRHGYTYHQVGKGLGLHICANYVSEMNGKIWAESEGENKGATFIMELPIHTSE